MNIEKCRECWFDGADGMPISTNRKLIIIEGPQGTGKTTVAKIISDHFNVPPARGFPTGQEIASANGSQPLICRSAFNRANTTTSPSDVLVFDRSPISQFAFMIRATSDNSYLDCLKHTQKIAVASQSVNVFFINSTPELCLQRQSPHTSLSLGDIAAIGKEIAVYNQLFDYLSRASIPNLRCHQIWNGPTSQLDVISHDIINIYSQNRGDLD